MHSFAVAERWGLIWIFNGPEPLCDPPGMREYGDDEMVVRARRTDLFPVEPWVIMANSYDYQHLRFVHGFEFEFDDTTVDWSVPYQIEEDMTFGLPDGSKIEQKIRTCGTNTVTYVTGGDIDSMGLFTSTPVPGGSQSYYIAATPDTRDGSPEQEAAVERAPRRAGDPRRLPPPGRHARVREHAVPRRHASSAPTAASGSTSSG